jgi:hypothetical protein
VECVIRKKSWPKTLPRSFFLETLEPYHGNLESGLSYSEPVIKPETCSVGSS